MAIQTYRELDVWKKAMDLAEMCYRITRDFPQEELFGLTTQIRRSAVSIPANIAEGQGRLQTRDYIRFLSMANGPLNELETHLILARRLGMLKDEQELDTVLKQASSIGQMLVKLRQSLTERLK